MGQLPAQLDGVGKEEAPQPAGLSQSWTCVLAFSGA